MGLTAKCPWGTLGDGENGLYHVCGSLKSTYFYQNSSNSITQMGTFHCTESSNAHTHLYIPQYLTECLMQNQYLGFVEMNFLELRPLPARFHEIYLFQSNQKNVFFLWNVLEDFLHRFGVHCFCCNLGILASLL